jgi:ketosteroid isomerase-like protein
VESNNIRQLRDGYEAFNRGDWESVLRNWHPDAEVHDRDEVPDPRDYQGLEGAREAFAGVVEMFDEYVIEPGEMLERGDTVLVVARQRGRGKTSGIEVEDKIVHVWTIQDGKVTDLRAFSTKEDALEHLGWPSS